MLYLFIYLFLHCHFIYFFFTSCHPTGCCDKRRGPRFRAGTLPQVGKQCRWVGGLGVYPGEERLPTLARDGQSERERRTWSKDDRGETRGGESGRKQRLLLKFPRARFHSGWQRGADVDSAPQPEFILSCGPVSADNPCDEIFSASLECMVWPLYDCTSK